MRNIIVITIAFFLILASFSNNYGKVSESKLICKNIGEIKATLFR